MTENRMPFILQLYQQDKLTNTLTIKVWT